ncbi:MAG: DUF6383 domain-containing protein [Dysgonamonadaceae bacterium]|nr:DUF6383 domain-containing protein [Dysgonamonadaceae bacterium]
MNRLYTLLIAFLTLPPFNVAGEGLVTPEWMVREKLLGFPLQHSQWLPSGLTHTYAFSIRGGKYTYSYKTGDEIREVELDGFGSMDIPLYRIQNDEGKYLTIDTTTYLYDRQSTVSGVTGVNLVWCDKYDDLAEDPARNKAALQLFAIAGAESGPENAWYPAGEGYLYLPLASYKAQYNTGTVLQDIIFYNKNIGLDDDDDGGLFRVSRYSPAGDGINHLVVADGSGIAQITPVKFRWKKPEYVQMNSDNRYLVRDVNDEFYYAGGGAGQSRLKRADALTILAHWEIRPDEEDPYLHTFVPELTEIYGEQPNTQLQGTYYFKKLSGNDLAMCVQAFDLSEYADAYTVKTDTFEIIYTTYESPYYDIPHYALPDQLVTLEVPFVDRNLTDKISGSGATLVGDHSYQVYLNRISGTNSLTFLTIYKTTEVPLGETEYVIPYFAFSLMIDDKEYFLHVVNTQQGDSVYWTRITDEERDILLNPEKYRDPQYKYQFKQYKFCLPYQMDVNGQRVTPVRYGEPGYEIEYQPLYLQTLSDDNPADYPYLIVVGNSTKYASAKRLNEVLLENNPEGNSLKWNIYSVDYSLVDQYSVTSWILAGKHSDENEWVSLYDADNGTPGTHVVQGLLTDIKFSGGGIIFIGESKESPVNYGALTGINNGMLEFIAEGQEMIGSYIKHPIFYYKIKIPDKDLYLTDSWHETDPKYKYLWSDGRKYPMAYFRDGKLADYEGYLPTRADERFVQTFGFRYIDPHYTENPIKETAQQTFVITSNASFRNYGSDKYRYLAETNGRLVFVDGIENVLIFQFGKKNEDGIFVGLEVIGRGEIFGVTGGVRLLNQAGKVDFYTIDGRLFKSVKITGSDQTIAAPRGVVIVRCGGKATKVLVK